MDRQKLKKATPVLNGNLLLRRESFGIIIYNKETRRKFFANDFAKEIIDFCDGDLTLSEIFDKIYKTKSGDSNSREAYSKFINFILELSHANIIKIENLKRIFVFDEGSIYPYKISNVTETLSAPLYIFWEVTYKCNLDCKHCYAKDRELKGKELTTAESLKIINELADLGVFEITFSGGEPLLRKDLPELIKYCNKKRITALLTTNATLIDRGTARKLKIAGLQAAQVSLDGINPGTHDQFRGVLGSFDGAIKGIKNLVAVGIPVVIATIPTKDNLSEIGKIFKLAKNLKVQGYRILECKPFGRGKEIMKDMISFEDYKKLVNWVASERKRLKNNFFILLSESFAFLENKQFSKKVTSPLIDCPAGRSMCSITPDGSVSACSYFSFAGVTLGNLLDQSLADIWKNSSFLNNLREIDFSKQKFNNKDCSECANGKKCGRGCRALAYYSAGDLYGLDPRCLKSISKGRI